MPAIEQRLTAMVIGVAPMSRDEFAQFIQDEIARGSQVIQAAGISRQ